MKLFDRKFGRDFIETIPTSPGVYWFLGAEGEVVYVGKAKNLRRRLGQYRNAKRLKIHKKMRSIISDAKTLHWEPCESDLEAQLNEIRLIQRHQPRRNIAGAFSVRYPLVGIREEKGSLFFCYTTVPQKITGFQLFGAFRSKYVTGEGFFSLMRLLKFLGSPVTRKRLDAYGGIPYTYFFGFRQLPAGWFQEWCRFFAGEDGQVLGELSCQLLEKASARAIGEEIEEDLHSIRQFWDGEIAPLAKAVAVTGYRNYPVPQSERDPLFIRFRDWRQNHDAANVEEAID